MNFPVATHTALGAASRGGVRSGGEDAGPFSVLIIFVVIAAVVILCIKSLDKW